MKPDFTDLIIDRPDGSTIPFSKLKPQDQLEHKLVTELCGTAIKLQDELKAFKADALKRLIDGRQMLLDAYQVKKGGKDGNLLLRTACGTLMAKMTVSKQITFGPELEAAKALIFEVVEDQLAQGASPFIQNLVKKVFSPNERGRIDTQGILNLRNEECDDVRWQNAMWAIEEAVIRDCATTYVNFYRCNPNAPTKADGEERIALDLAKL
ncbi:MAG: DUF3164 family protein [Pseudomonadota bacterium]